ncbi:MAG: hypothetical protein PVG39_02170 [Desulfobacteraceae bacterium]|jgi:hypothetical protein
MKNCIGCKYAKWDRTKTGRLSPTGEGRCTFAIKMPVLPTSMFWSFRVEPNPSGGFINRRKEFENHCPCYQPE